MADEQIGDAELLLQVLHQVQHLRLHRHVQCTDRLVGHDEFRAGDERPGNGDALALAARKLVRVFVKITAAQSDGIQHGLCL